MNRPFLRELAKRAGYHVEQRSSHGAAPAYDWYPKDPMLGRHFASEEAAWADLESTMSRKLEQATKLVALAGQLVTGG